MLPPVFDVALMVVSKPAVELSSEGLQCGILPLCVGVCTVISGCRRCCSFVVVLTVDESCVSMLPHIHPFFRQRRVAPQVQQL